MKKIVLFASGSGSNAENIIKYFEHNSQVSIACVLTNKRSAKIIDRCNKLNINCLYFNKIIFSNSDCILKILHSLQPDLIVLAGFLLKIPQAMVEKYPNQIINIHPALLPKFGGKGMYGKYVHQAVKEHKERETGITIHYVNENYDDGAILFQAKTQLLPTDSVETIAKKVSELEYAHFPQVIEELLSSQNITLNGDDPFKEGRK